MDVDEIYGQAGKRSRRNEEKLSQKPSVQHQDEEDEDGVGKGQGEGDRSHHSSWHSQRIFRVARATGGKDRHSKVFTAKGLRDRRVRLSVSTALQFYDIQDRLGFDQPSKAIEWLIEAAAADIAELPLLNDTFLHTTKQLAADDERHRSSGPKLEEQKQQHLFSLSKSTCSSTSETSKGSLLTLSRSENRVKARERARHRTAKEKEREKDKEESHFAHQKSVNCSSHGSFTELLAGCTTNNPISTARQNPSRYFPLTAMDCFAQTHQHSYLAGDNLDLQQLSLLQDHLMPVVAGAASDYNLNFSISSGIAGFSRGTLQSNLPSTLTHRFSSPADGPFFVGPVATATAGENQFCDGHLQICYGNINSHSDFKGKGKN